MPFILDPAITNFNVTNSYFCVPFLVLRIDMATARRRLKIIVSLYGHTSLYCTYLHVQ